MTVAAVLSRSVLIAPDSFKGSLTSVQVAQALAEGWRRARPDDQVELCPLADGGEGTLAAIEAAGGWTPEVAIVMDPECGSTEARWLRSATGKHAYVEMAQASGLSLVPLDRRVPSLLTSYGTGQLIKTVLDAGLTKLTLGIGGTATNDGGLGILQALGARPLNEEGAVPVEEPTPTRPVLFMGIERIDLTGLDARLGKLDVEVACDVTNPLLGHEGATEVYGPQKGATSADDRWILEIGLKAVADALEEATGRHERDTPGAGAAGGVGFALLAIQDRFRSFALRPGIELVMEAAGFDDKLARADLVITGEGRIDAQTAFGKTALGVASRARAAGVPCIAVGGGVDEAGIVALASVDAIVVPVAEQPHTVEEAMAAGTAPLERTGERLARLVGLLTKSSD